MVRLLLTGTTHGRWMALLATLLLATGCASEGPYRINLMDAPDVYEQGGIDPFAELDPIQLERDRGILYVTDRQPTDPPDQPPYYQNERGHVLRLGWGDVRLAAEGATWEEARRISLLKNRTDKYPIQVFQVEEYGVLERTVSDLMKPEIQALRSPQPEREFAERVNRQLARSQVKDVFVYVHGFKVNFENPLLVASELWHYLGYEGAFVAYSWPSTPSIWAYAKDTETTDYAARNLRLFLQFLAEETDAETINVVGYSAGTRVVTGALYQLALIHQDEPKNAVVSRTRLGHVVLVGSDVDRQLFGAYLEDGIWRVAKHLNVYLSGTDKALGMSRWFFKQGRLGQLTQVNPRVAEVLREYEDLVAINVTDAEKAGTGNGHAYFRQSPWASSDILMTLRYDLLPVQRGLVREGDSPLWTFPDNYIQRLRASIFEANPELAARARQLGEEKPE